MVSEHSADVTAVVRKPQRAARIQNLGARIRAFDLANRAAVLYEIKDHELVINLAHDFRRSLNSNLKIFKNLADACETHNVRRLVHTSSIAVYDDWPSGNLSEDSASSKPGSEYKNTKIAIENDLSRRYSNQSLASVVIQPTIVYGPHSRFWTDHLAELLLTGVMTLPNAGQGLCNAVYVDDVADALILAATGRGLEGKKFIISGPAPVTWSKFFASYERALGTNSVRYIDAAEDAVHSFGTLGRLRSFLRIPVQQVSYRLQSILGERAMRKLRMRLKTIGGKTGATTHRLSASDLELYQSSGRCDIGRAANLLGYAPKFDFERGSALTAEYLRQRYGSP